MKRIFLIIIALVGVLQLVVAQDIAEKLYKVYLYDRSVLRGNIQSMNKEGDVFLKVYKDTVVLKVPSKSIKRMVVIESSAIEKEVDKKSEIKQYGFREKGFYATFSVGLAPGNYSANKWRTSQYPGFCSYGTFGYQFNRLYSLALGLGSEVFYADHRLFPIFFETKGYWFPKKFTPYHSLGLGYTIAAKNENKDIVSAIGNIFVCPSIGYRFGGKDNFNFYSEIGFRIQQSTYIKAYPWDPIETKYEENWIYKRFLFKFGIHF